MDQNRHVPAFKKLTVYRRERTARSGLVLQANKMGFRASLFYSVSLRFHICKMRQLDLDKCFPPLL